MCQCGQLLLKMQQTARVKAYNGFGSKHVGLELPFILYLQQLCVHQFPALLRRREYLQIGPFVIAFADVVVLASRFQLHPLTTHLLARFRFAAGCAEGTGVELEVLKVKVVLVLLHLLFFPLQIDFYLQQLQLFSTLSLFPQVLLQAMIVKLIKSLFDQRMQVEEMHLSASHLQKFTHAPQ